jgi:acyl carrier protein phosphodiesterase
MIILKCTGAAKPPAPDQWHLNFSGIKPRQVNLHPNNMNYLAHAYLSFGNPAWVTGNLISDFVKGKKRYDYSPGIQQGIELHRAIDDFTDSHEAIRSAKEIFRPAYRLYAGAFVDVAYDHFLANDPLHFPDEATLAKFTGETYESLSLHYPLLPGIFHTMFDRMKQQNWLYNYRFRWGMEKSFTGLVYRARYLDDAAPAFALFEKFYDRFKDSYDAFFPDLNAFAVNFVNDKYRQE